MADASSTGADEIEDSAAPLIEHLAELRTRLIRCAMAFVVAMLICFTIWNPIYNFLTAPLCTALENGGQACELIFIKLQEGFMVAVQISIFGGFILAFPVIGHQLWRFVAPGLYKTEKNAFLPFLVASPVLFFIGAAFAYYVVTPLAFDFFLLFQQGEVTAEGAAPEGDLASIVFQGSAQEYLALTMKFVIAFGLCFQLPVLLTLMGKAGLVSADGLRSTRKYAVVGILVLAAVATPPDVISQVILFTAVYGLYEISIHLVAYVERKREERLREEGYYDDEDDAEAAADLEDAAQSEGDKA